MSTDDTSPRVFAVLLAAGLTGSESTRLPAALSILDGAPAVVVAATELRGSALLRSVPLVVVAPIGAVGGVRSALVEHGLMSAVSIVEGDSTLDGSFHKALEHLDKMLHAESREPDFPSLPDRASAGKAGDRLVHSDPIVVIHDASRPLAGAKLTDRVLAASMANAGRPVVPILGMTETVKRVDPSGKITDTIPRESVVRVQMPQASSLSRLRRVHAECMPTGRERIFLVGIGEDTVLVPGDDLAMPVRTATERELASALRRRRSLRPGAILD